MRRFAVKITRLNYKETRTNEFVDNTDENIHLSVDTAKRGLSLLQ